VAAMRAHDLAHDWSDRACADTAATFLGAAGERDAKGGLEARYDAGVAYQRCRNDSEAKRLFAAILAADPKFHHARVQLALYQLEEGGERALESALGEVQRAVRDAEFKDSEALVQLAILQMRRRSARADDDGADDLERARKNLQRALAVDDGFMPAYNQLAIYYLERAKEQAGQGRGPVAAATSPRRAETAALDLADLVVSQAIRRTSGYGPVYNTSGLVRAELGDLSGAAQAFAKARELDPRFFEAHMNYAAVNLQFRGFRQAEAAYRAALVLRPTEYEAHLGLALAIRAQIDDTNLEPRLGEALAELAAAERIDPSRPETYYNRAILVQEFKTRKVAAQGPKAQDQTLREARGIFDQFLRRAEGRKELQDAVRRAQERQKDIDDILAFTEQGAEERKRLEAAHPAS
jgi:tetratricopeptide (TPR) repeat protein